MKPALSSPHGSRKRYHGAMFDPDQPLTDGRLVVFDTEATGLSPARDRVIEIAAIAYEDGRQNGTFESLINPGIPIPEALTAIHGIDDEMVKDSPPFKEVAAKFLDFIEGSTLAAHNSPYDMAMLFRPMVDEGMEPEGNPVIDTCRLARRLINSPNYQLSTLASALGIDTGNAHRAMPDVLACAAVLFECLNLLGRNATMAEVENSSAARLRFGRDVDVFDSPPKHLVGIQHGIDARKPVRIVYKGGSHGESPRVITPLYLAELDGSLAVSAICHINGGLKNFRLRLMEKASVA
jgi:DNA polymerase-3 subunit epsilon